MSQIARPPDEGKKRIPGATYRLQFHREFTFRDACEIAEYLRDLGITDVYASPLFKAGPNSAHGYDVCDFQQLSPELGGRVEFERFASRLRELGLGLMLDMVPNHMGTDLSNRWWFDLLENGRSSPYGTYFDINWQPAIPGLRDRVLMPILEDHYGAVLESGKLQLIAAEEGPAIEYHGQQFPIAARNADPKSNHAPAEAAHPRVRQVSNGQPGKPETFDALHELLQSQHYRLAFWKTGSEQINYRRFFDVSSLICLRMERPEVFKAAHQLVFELIREASVTALRIDHPDGLWDPKEYFDRLQSEAGAPLYVVAEKILSFEERLRPDWKVEGTTGYDFLNQLNGLFVNRANERALERTYREFSGNPRTFGEEVKRSKKRILQECLTSELNALTEGLRQLCARSRYGQDFTWRQLRCALVELVAAFPVYRTYLTEKAAEVAPSERQFIEQAVAEAQEQDPTLDRAVFRFLEDLLLLRFPRDFAEEQKRDALVWLMRFQQLTGPVAAKGVEDTAFYNYNRLLSLNEVGGDPAQFGVSTELFHELNQARASEWPHSLLATATHDTKRGEDVRARLNVLSELPGEWHAALQRWSRLNADKKTPVRGEPAPHPNDEYLLYQTLLGAWPPQPAAPGKAGLRPDSEGPKGWAGQAFCERIGTYLLKAIREAKARTTWTEPNTAYEEASRRFVERLLDPQTSATFLEDFGAFQRRLTFFGQFNSLAQVLLKITAPGVPDFYQGTELWDLNLVDPDNRQPVDYATRRARLRELKEGLERFGAEPRRRMEALLRESATGQVKLFVIAQALACRQRWRSVFDSGEYRPLAVRGPNRDHVCAFARVYEGQAVLTIVPRLVCGLTRGAEAFPTGDTIWRDTFLEIASCGVAGGFRNVLTNERLAAVQSAGSAELAVGRVLALLPVALLEQVRPTS
jgi:(1->4)-alpha-D-glucan 1-alpha-D-glucosylmutase